MVACTKVQQSNIICVNFSYPVRTDDRFPGAKSYTSIEIPQNDNHIFGWNGGRVALKLIIECIKWFISF